VSAAAIFATRANADNFVGRASKIDGSTLERRTSRKNPSPRFGLSGFLTGRRRCRPWVNRDRVETVVGPVTSAMPPKAEALAAAVIGVCRLMLPPLDMIQAPKPEPRILRYELSDYEWTAIKPMLPNKPRGVRRVNDRRVLNGIFWVLRSGAPWRDVSESYGPYTTC
jgi:hypothetical protein